MVSQCSVMGATIGLLVFGTWMVLTKAMNVELIVARSLVMALMVFLQNFHALNCRSEKQSIAHISITSNWFFFVAVFGSIGLQILFMEIPLLSKFLDLTTVDYGTLFVLLALSLVVFVVGEVYKVFVRRYDKKLNA